MAEQSFFDKVSTHSMHVPDVLSCIANLSNDEVFTPPEVVNNMLDLLPQELFANPETTFLDPATKTGVFLREIAKRCLAAQLPGYSERSEEIAEKKAMNIPLDEYDVAFQKQLQETIDHIFHKQLYGIGITELTSLLARRSVYCSKYPNGPYSITHFDDSEGNIRFRKTKHVWKDGKCVWCGANQKEYDRDSELESHAYEFIHVKNPEDIFKMKFDVVISNPPYQMSDGGGTGDSAKPIYHHFVEQALKLHPLYLTMIIPSRWLKGGKGLDSFRNQLMNDTHISKLYDYENASECFSGIHLDGGVCYFLWNKNYDGKTDYTYKLESGEEITASRYLKNEVSSTVIRDYRQISIIEKVYSLNEEKFNKIVSSRKPFGIATDLFNHPENYPRLNLSMDEREGYFKIYGVKGKKGGAKRLTGYVNPIGISDEYNAIDKYKLYFSYAYSTNAVNPPQIIEGAPFELSTETFLLVGPFENEQMRKNCLAYMQTKFFKALLYFNRIQKNASSRTFELIPLLDFSKNWTDEELFTRYKLNDKEIAFINSLFEKNGSVASDDEGDE